MQLAPLGWGNILAWLTGTLTLAYSAGRVSTALAAIAEAVWDLRAEFREQTREDAEQFTWIRHQLLDRKK